MLDLEDQRLLVELSGSGPCSMNRSPKKNWVEKSGGLPSYICHIAKAVGRGGHGTGGSIAIAVGTVKKWAHGGGDVSAATRAKAASAVAQWEALKARNKARHTVKATDTTRDMLSVSLSNDEDFNTSIVGSAWGEYMDHCRTMRQAHEQLGEDWDGPVGYEYIKELWNNFVIACGNDESGENRFWRVPYEVSGTDVDFGSWTEVRVQYVDAPGNDNDYDDIDLSDDALAELAPHMGSGGYGFYDRPAPAEIRGW